MRAVPLDKLVIASANPGKLRELQALLRPLAIEVIAQSQVGVSETQEPYATFVENALAKARHACESTGLPALADDSGICADALGGAPGVHSARFAGGPKSDARNNEKLVAELRRHADRNAHYYCVIVLLRRAQDPQPIITTGAWHGVIVDEPRGSGGFGYDPYFYLPQRGMTAAELPCEEKNRISHRGQALAALLEAVKRETGSKS